MQRRARTSRRSIVAFAAMAIPARIAVAQEATTVSEPDDNRVDAPAWSFHLISVQIPYAGTLQVPPEILDDTGVIAIEIEIANDSDQALNFTPIDVRLRDVSGMEYRGGAAIGTEPMINPRNLNPGERSRGWVWYIVPESAQIVEVVYVAPQPQFRVRL